MCLSKPLFQSPLLLQRCSNQRALATEVAVTLHVRGLFHLVRGVAPCSASRACHDESRGIVVQGKRHGFVISVGDVGVARHTDGAGLARVPGEGVECDDVRSVVNHLDDNGSFREAGGVCFLGDEALEGEGGDCCSDFRGDERGGLLSGVHDGCLLLKEN